MSNEEHAELSDPTRPETGPMQFGDGGRGYFIDYADALNLRALLRRVLDAAERGEVPDRVAQIILSTFADALVGVNHYAPPETLQRCRPWAECAATNDDDGARP